ncbi:MAG: serine/threonine-protein kinase [Rhodocyclaceae bacterium]
MSSDPQKLGKYEIQGVLGKGGMGTVYKGYDPLIQRTVALKTVHSRLLENDDHNMLERFRNEARAAGRLNHPGIVAIYDYGEENGIAYIAMEYVDGCTLGDFLKAHKRVPVADVVAMMLQFLEALHYAHEQGIVHRDIKAANILITAAGKLKIMDFGIARLDSSSLTLVGSVVGTPGSMAPEQLMGLAVDRRADLFSAGVVLYELLCGVRPFTGPSESLVYKVCYEHPPLPSAIDSSIHPALDVVISKALAKQADERFATADIFKQALVDAHAKAFSAQPTATLSDATVILTSAAIQERMAALGKPPGAGGPRTMSATSAPPPTSASLITSMHADTLLTVERLLAQHIGPLAKVIVKKAATSTASIDDFYAILTSKLDTEAARRDFMAAMRKLGVGAPPASHTQTPPKSATKVVSGGTMLANTLGAEVINLAATRLAKYLGPIAPVVTRKAAAQAVDARALYWALAGNLTNPDDRRAFLNEAGFPEY